MYYSKIIDDQMRRRDRQRVERRNQSLLVSIDGNGRILKKNFIGSWTREGMTKSTGPGRFRSSYCVARSLFQSIPALLNL
jgi:hypothetical protein